MGHGPIIISIVQHLKTICICSASQTICFLRWCMFWRLLVFLAPLQSSGSAGSTDGSWMLTELLSYLMCREAHQLGPRQGAGQWKRRFQRLRWWCWRPGAVAGVRGRGEGVRRPEEGVRRLEAGVRRLEEAARGLVAGVPAAASSHRSPLEVGAAGSTAHTAPFALHHEHKRHIYIHMCSHTAGRNARHDLLLVGLQMQLLLLSTGLVTL